VDSGVIEVNRRHKHAKTDPIDAGGVAAAAAAGVRRLGGAAPAGARLGQRAGAAAARGQEPSCSP